MAVLLGAGFTSCEKEDDIRPLGVKTEPVQTKPTEIGQEEQGIGQPVSEMENPVHDEPR